MNEFPTTSKANIKKLIANTPCFYQDSNRFVAPIDPESMIDMIENRHMHHGDIWKREGYFKERLDRQAYYATFGDVRAELTNDEYRKFYYLYRKWEQANYNSWWKDYKW